MRKAVRNLFAILGAASAAALVPSTAIAASNGNPLVTAVSIVACLWLFALGMSKVEP